MNVASVVSFVWDTKPDFPSNTVLFSWYYKGVELLWCFLVMHPTGVDLEELDLEAMDKEVANEAT